MDRAKEPLGRSTLHLETIEDEVRDSRQNMPDDLRTNTEDEIEENIYVTNANADIDRIIDVFIFRFLWSAC